MIDIRADEATGTVWALRDGRGPWVRLELETGQVTEEYTVQGPASGYRNEDEGDLAVLDKIRHVRMAGKVREAIADALGVDVSDVGSPAR